MFSPPQRHDPEFLDIPGQDPRELWGLLQSIRRVNSRFGGRRLILHYLSEFIPQIPHRPVTVLDVATASADIPCAIARWARRRALPVRITAIDRSSEILTLARVDAAHHPEIVLMRADATRLPFGDHAFDVVNCGLTLHHFTLEGGAQVLREIQRVARAFVVHDIVRSWTSYAGAWLDTRLRGNRLARHDGPLSVLRSFTVAEFRQMAALAGIPDVEVHTHPVFRIALVRRPLESPA